MLKDMQQQKNNKKLMPCGSFGSLLRIIFKKKYFYFNVACDYNTMLFVCNKKTLQKKKRRKSPVSRGGIEGHCRVYERSDNSRRWRNRQFPEDRPRCPI